MIFRLVLWSIGTLLWAASRVSPRVQAQLSRDMEVVIYTQDGVARTFIVRDRRMTSIGQRYDHPTFAVCFSTAGLGARILLARDTINRILDGLERGDIEIMGQAAVLVWFYELTMGLSPFNRRPVDVWPDAYVEHDPNSKVSARITREPVTHELDPNWLTAHDQREKTLLWQVGRGAKPGGIPVAHKIVVPNPDDIEGNRA